MGARGFQTNNSVEVVLRVKMGGLAIVAACGEEGFMFTHNAEYAVPHHAAAVAPMSIRHPRKSLVRVLSFACRLRRCCCCSERRHFIDLCAGLCRGVRLVRPECPKSPTSPTLHCSIDNIHGMLCWCLKQGVKINCSGLGGWAVLGPNDYVRDPRTGLAE